MSPAYELGTARGGMSRIAEVFCFRGREREGEGGDGLWVLRSEGSGLYSCTSAIFLRLACLLCIQSLFLTLFL